MAITELVFPIFKPALAREGRAAAKTEFKAFLGATGLLHHRLGSITRHNGEDVTDQYRSVLNIEWQDPSSFYALYPNSPVFQNVMGKILPYAAAKAAPQLFNPASGYDRSEASFTSGATQFFTGKVGEQAAEAKSAWENLIAALKKEGEEVVEWTGEGIDDAEGHWLGVLGWASIEKIDTLAKNGNVLKAIEGLRSVGGVQEYGVVFEGFESEA